MPMRVTSPAANAIFTITSGAEWPGIPFVTDASGPHVWTWRIVWSSFSRSGTENTAGNQWDAKAAVTNLGGVLTVSVRAGRENATASVTIKGTNPTKIEVDGYLATKPDSGGFEKIIEHEARYRHFNASGQPIKSFDNGYGMCQLTTPTPSYEQIWNWKMNVDGGLALFAQKKRAAIAYLSGSGRSYTTQQANYEAVSRWNGGAYHTWDAAAGAWVRNPDMLCDTATGNIGWDMTDPDNAGQTEAQLHQRDSAAFSAPRPAGANWRYLGVCYADRILG